MSRPKGRRGLGWETVLEAQHAEYLRHLRAKVSKQHVPFKRTKTLGGGAFEAVYDGKADCDFAGLLHDGRGVAFDAKEVQAGAFPFSKLLLHQAKHLNAVSHFGGVSFVALHVVGDASAYVLRWDRVGPLWWAWKTKASKAASVLPLEIERMPVLGDWLPVVEAW